MKFRALSWVGYKNIIYFSSSVTAFLDYAKKIVFYKAMELRQPATEPWDLYVSIPLERK